jgi:hypothetical protein
MSVQVDIKGLKGVLDYFEKLPEIASQAASFAINDVTGGPGLALLRKAVYDEIDFPAGYLTKERLGQKERATPTKLQASIRGRDRATSLARFATRGQTPRNTRRGAGVKVQVKGGKVRDMKGAWLVNLRNGNTGLAVRLRPGERLNSKAAVELAPNVFLLYGPSVDQVFGDVAWKNRDEIGDLLSNQFFRQVRRLSNG